MKHLIAILLTINVFIMNAQLPQHIELKELGLSFDLPEGWTGQMMEEYILAGHKTLPGLMFLFENNSTSAEELQRLAMQGIEDDGVQLTPRKDFKVTGGNRVEGMYQGSFDGSEVVAYGIGLINGLGSGMNIVVLTEPDKFTEAHKIEANKLAKSVKFFEAVENEQVTFWKNRIIGYKLRYMYSYQSTDINGGYINDRINIDIDLCTNGRFYYLDSRYTSIDTGVTETGTSSSTSLGRSDNEGDFEIYMEDNTPYLNLVADSGKVRTYSLAITSDDVPLLYGDKYYVDYSDRCQ